MTASAPRLRPCWLPCAARVACQPLYRTHSAVRVILNDVECFLDHDTSVNAWLILNPHPRRHHHRVHQGRQPVPAHDTDTHRISLPSPRIKTLNSTWRDCECLRQGMPQFCDPRWPTSREWMSIASQESSTCILCLESPFGPNPAALLVLLVCLILFVSLVSRCRGTTWWVIIRSRRAMLGRKMAESLSVLK